MRGIDIFIFHDRFPNWLYVPIGIGAFYVADWLTEWHFKDGKK